MNRMASLLARIRDQRSAQQLSGQVQALSEDLMQSEERAKALPALTEEQDNQLLQKYDASLQAAKERVDREQRGSRRSAEHGRPRVLVGWAPPKSLCVR